MQCQQRLQVLHGCPWVLPRPVFVLAHGDRDSELGGAVTLRVRVEQDAADELAQVGVTGRA